MSDAKVIKALADLGLHNEPKLTPEQEQLLKNALDDQEAHLSKLLDIYKTPKEND